MKPAPHTPSVPPKGAAPEPGYSPNAPALFTRLRPVAINVATPGGGFIHAWNVRAKDWMRRNGIKVKR